VKITKQKLKQIIKEELEVELKEFRWPWEKKAPVPWWERTKCGPKSRVGSSGTAGVQRGDFYHAVCKGGQVFCPKRPPFCGDCSSACGKNAAIAEERAKKVEKQIARRKQQR